MLCLYTLPLPYSSYFGLFEVLRVDESVSEEKCREVHVLGREMQEPFEHV